VSYPFSCFLCLAEMFKQPYQMLKKLRKLQSVAYYSDCTKGIV